MTRVSDMTKYDLIAWAIACEGCITLTRQSRDRKSYALHPKITFHNTNEGLGLLFQELVGDGKIHSQRDYSPKHKDRWIWQLSGYKEIKMFLEDIIDYLPIKEEQARIVLEFCSRRLNIKKKGINFKLGQTTWSEKDEEDRLRINKLNKRGKQEVSLLVV